jgi:hypothetical protein
MFMYWKEVLLLRKLLFAVIVTLNKSIGLQYVDAPLLPLYYPPPRAPPGGPPPSPWCSHAPTDKHAVGVVQSRKRGEVHCDVPM